VIVEYGGRGWVVVIAVHIGRYTIIIVVHYASRNVHRQAVLIPLGGTGVAKGFHMKKYLHAEWRRITNGLGPAIPVRHIELVTEHIKQADGDISIGVGGLELEVDLVSREQEIAIVVLITGTNRIVRWYAENTGSRVIERIVGLVKIGNTGRVEQIELERRRLIAWV
jgi:hypothetical protein